MTVKLYVGNLSYTTMEEDLRTLFSKDGEVSSCEIVLDKFTGKSRGFAFVEMSSPEDAERAIKQLHDYEFEGRKLIVNEARPREERGGGFGGKPSGGNYGGGRKSGKGSRRGARNAKRNKKAAW